MVHIGQGKRSDTLGILSCLKRDAKNASTNGGDASRVGKKFSYYLVWFVSFLLIIPTRDASPPLVLAFFAAYQALVFTQYNVPRLQRLCVTPNCCNSRPSVLGEALRTMPRKSRFKS